jgi:hypothetical protein
LIYSTCLSEHLDHLRAVFDALRAARLFANLDKCTFCTERVSCNTPGVTMATAHLGTQDYDHMWKNLRNKSIRGFGN